MTDIGYAPFPESDLLLVAEFHENVAKRATGYFAGLHLERARVCRDAHAAHDALRTRFLEQSMRVRELEAMQAKVA